MKLAALPSGGGRVTRLSREAEVEEATPRAENLPPIRIPRLMPSSVIGNVDIAAVEQTIGQTSFFKQALNVTFGRRRGLNGVTEVAY